MFTIARYPAQEARWKNPKNQQIRVGNGLSAENKKGALRLPL
jgi:hypothetical protein